MVFIGAGFGAALPFGSTSSTNGDPLFQQTFAPTTSFDVTAPVVRQVCVEVCSCIILQAMFSPPFFLNCNSHILMKNLVVDAVVGVELLGV